METKGQNNLESLAAISAGGSLAGNMINFASQMITNEQNRQYQTATNRENMLWQEYIMDKNRRNYLEDREYNSPASMMKRLTAAGLNKNLLAGGNFTGMTAPQAPASASPSSLSPRNDAPQLDPATLSQLALNEAQRENIEADTENKRFENSEEQRELRTRYATAIADNMGAVARQNITKADIDEALKSIEQHARGAAAMRLNAESRGAVSDVYYNALMRYGHKIANFDYRYSKYDEETDGFRDLPGGVEGDRADFQVAKDCIAYIEKELLKLEKEGKINLNRISGVDADIAETLKDFNTYSPFIRSFIALLRLFAK